MITIEEFRTRFPEYCDEQEYSDDRIQLFIDDTVNIYIGSDESRWSGKYGQAQAYLTAHLLTLAESTELGDANSKSGPIQSKTAGGVSVSRAVVSKNRSDADDFYMSTSYGQRFLIIRNSCFAGVSIANYL